MAEIKDVSVIIIGGGGCGLTCSSFLSDYGIDHILFERHSSTSIMPKAHYLNQRTMEVFRQHKMNEEINRKGAPLENFRHVAWATSLGGDDATDRKVMAKFACFGGDDGSQKVEMYKRDSPTRSANLPLVRLEPILRDLATKRNPGRVLFNHNVLDFTDKGESVQVVVQDPEGNKKIYRCQYLIGADGGRFVGSEIGVEMDGVKGITDMVSLHFGADLSAYWDDSFFACHFINGSGSTVFESGALVPMGPTWGKHSEEWIFHFGFDLNDENRFDEERILTRARELMKIPDLQMKVHKISHWILERVLANKYSEGRIFIAGDAAHRRPPTTGLGLNTAIEDAHNLAWKLALVLKGQAPPRILQTYESERRPVGKRNCDWGLFTFTNSSVINAAIGLLPGQPEANRKSFQSLFEESAIGRSRRAQVSKIVETQMIEFSAHDIEIGFRYDDGFRVDDGTKAPESDPLGQVYFPSTIPGHRLPHVWLQKEGQKVSTHDLVGDHGSFLLITDSYGKDWVSAAEKYFLAHKLKITTVRIGLQGDTTADVDAEDLEGEWARLKSLDQGGAILVRPDNFVAWRSKAASGKEGLELAKALTELFE